MFTFALSRFRTFAFYNFPAVEVTDSSVCASLPSSRRCMQFH